MNASTVRDLNESTPRRAVALGFVASAGCCQRDFTEVDFRPKPGISRETSNSSRYLVRILACSAAFRQYQQAFEDVTGLPLTLRAVEGLQLAHHGNRRQNGFCALMSQSSRSCAACLQLQQRVCEGVNGEPCTMSCTFGLNETAVGVKVGNDLIAYLLTGQVFFKPPTPRQTQNALQQIEQWGFSLDAGEAARRYNDTPVVCRVEYQASVRLLQFFAEQLGTTANQIVMQQQTAEPAQIARARQFIDAHYQEDLSLATVARQAGMSPSYFCKRFKKIMGLNFNHYLSRCRVEKAKHLLLNRNYRASEIADEVGFRSAAHFNRVFRRIARESPTDYRQRLATT